MRTVCILAIFVNLRYTFSYFKILSIFCLCFIAKILILFLSSALNNVKLYPYMLFKSIT